MLQFKPGEWARRIGGGWARYGVPVRCAAAGDCAGLAGGRNRLSRADAGGRGARATRVTEKAWNPFDFL